jgi:hypothetical protein
VSPRLEAAFSRAEQVVGRRIGDAYVLVPLAGRGADLDSVLNLNPVAAFVWEQLDGARTGNAIVQAVVERFEVERARAEADTLELLDTLLERGAIRLFSPLSPSVVDRPSGGGLGSSPPCPPRPDAKNGRP